MSEELVNKIHKVTPGAVHGFFKDYRWLSNYHLCDIEWYDTKFSSTEAAYQASKIDMIDEANITKFSEFSTMTPSEAKKAGQLIPIRKDWDQVKDEIMFKINMIKYLSCPDLKEKLLATGDKELVEDNWWGDSYWGRNFGEGRNMLGITLMKIRARLQYIKELEDAVKKSESLIEEEDHKTILEAEKKVLLLFE